MLFLKNTISKVVSLVVVYNIISITLVIDTNIRDTNIDKYYPTFDIIKNTILFNTLKIKDNYDN